MVYYVEIDGDEHEFDRSWQVIDFMVFNGLKKLTVFYLRGDGKSVQYNFYDNGADKIFPVTDNMGQQMLDKNLRPIRKLVERWKITLV
jgi:hypothetical protein